MPQPNAASLDEKSRTLDERRDAAKRGEEMYMAIRLDLLRKIIDELDNDPELAKIFGGDVAKKLGLISMRSDIKISELKLAKISDKEAQIFLERLRGILKKNLTE